MQNFDVSSLINIPVVGICFVVGYLIKNSIPKIPNKCIPSVVTVVGAIVGVIISATSGDASLSSISDGFISGAISGLASTGSYEFIVNIFGLKNKKEDNSTHSTVFQTLTYFDLKRLYSRQIFTCSCINLDSFALFYE